MKEMRTAEKEQKLERNTRSQQYNTEIKNGMVRKRKWNKNPWNAEREKRMKCRGINIWSGWGKKEQPRGESFVELQTVG